MIDKKTLKSLENRTLIGIVEKIELFGKKGSKKVFARIDSGATLSSIDISLAKELDFGPVLRQKFVKSAQGNKLKDVVETTIKIADKKLTENVTLSDRSQLRFQALIGQNILKNNFLIDPQITRKKELSELKSNKKLQQEDAVE